MYDEGELLDEVIRSGLPCELELTTYNDALSLQAKLNRYIQTLNLIYSAGDTESKHPFENMDIILIKPRTLRFQQHKKPRLKPVAQPFGSKPLADKLDPKNINLDELDLGEELDPDKKH